MLHKILCFIGFHKPIKTWVWNNYFKARCIVYRCEYCKKSVAKIGRG